MTGNAETDARPQLKPFALQDAPALIERVFPSQKVSAEAQKERKANLGQTLTGLGSYWKGRKPLIMVRAIVLGSLLPATEDTEADLAIFEKLLGMDDASFARREPKLKPADLAERISLTRPWNYFTYTLRGETVDPETVDALTFPVKLADYPGLSLRWRRGLSEEDKETLFREALAGLTYEEKVGLCKRPEEVDSEWLYGPVMADVNRHLGSFGIEANSHEELTEQLGILRFGHRPKVGDTFCGGGSVPFEAARIGCDVYASDLNPIAAMLTWGALNIIGASQEKREEIEAEQKRVAKKLDREITNLGIEHNERGDRAKAYLYCLETRCPQTGWMVPMAPSWVISTQRKVVARLRPDHSNKRFEIEIISGVSQEELKAAEKGTVQNEQLVYELDGEEYRTPIRTLRGDYRDEEGNLRNQLRQWDLHDFKPRPGDVFQERLYCIQWMKAETLNDGRPEIYFASVTDGDLAREAKVDRVVENNLANWQEKGLVPDMPIESGTETARLQRERGWQYWHQLFSPRQIHYLSLLSFYAKKTKFPPEIFVAFAKSLDREAKLCRWSSGYAQDIPLQTFSNQALNTVYNWGVRAVKDLKKAFFMSFNNAEPLNTESKIEVINSEEVKYDNDLWITDPPYADAVNYHEITEFFIAWLRKNPPEPFDQWIWDSRRSLAIQGAGEDFRRSMVESYSAMAKHMPDNGVQCVMFTHKDTSVWGDMVSIFWAAGLQVVGAWYIATEASTALRDGAHVQGTVLLMLRKRGEGGSGFRSRLLPQIRNEVANQVDQMMHLDERARSHGNVLFNDADLQMAGYAAALKVLTAYTRFDGKDVTALALQPRERGEANPIDEIVNYARQVANNYLIPERLKELNPETWQEGLTPAERFYLRLLAIEHSGEFKLENHQNFGKAFQIDPEPLMASLQANGARLKGAADFRPRDLESGVLGRTNLGYILIAVQELLEDGDPASLVSQMRSGLVEEFYQRSDHLIAIAQYIADMVANQRPEEAEAAEIIANRLRNERL